MKTNDIINSFGLLISDAQCYRAIGMKLIETSKSDRPALLGDANGAFAFMSIFFNQDISTLVFEGLKLLLEQGKTENELLADRMPGYYERLKSVRNSIHLYNKSGSYRPKATEIVKSQLELFDMLSKDALFELRNDISLIYEISKENKKLLGTNYNVSHILESKFSWTGEDIRQYSQDTATLLNMFSSLDWFALPEPDETVLTSKHIQIELFDFKSADLFKLIHLDSATTFRLLLMLSAISYVECLFEMYIDIDKTLKSDIWLCFLNKLVAVKYDEVFDSLDNLLVHINDKDKKVLVSIFQSDRINIKKLKRREVAKNLRNMIHYASNDFAISSVENDKVEINVCQIYARKSGLTTWDAMGDNLLGMIEDLSLAGDVLREVINSGSIK